MENIFIRSQIINRAECATTCLKDINYLDIKKNGYFFYKKMKKKTIYFNYNNISLINVVYKKL